MTNETFASSNDHDIATLDKAAAEALKAALRIGSDQVAGGKHFFAAEVTVESEDEMVRRYIVSIGASPIMIADLPKGNVVAI